MRAPWTKRQPSCGFGKLLVWSMYVLLHRLWAIREYFYPLPSLPYLPLAAERNAFTSKFCAIAALSAAMIAGATPFREASSLPMEVNIFAVVIIWESEADKEGYPSPDMWSYIRPSRVPHVYAILRAQAIISSVIAITCECDYGPSTAH
jgi:hypothetical protein